MKTKPELPDIIKIQHGADNEPEEDLLPGLRNYYYQKTTRFVTLQRRRHRRDKERRSMGRRR
jgi:hypothetical protein